jgi:glutaminyl-tRNA synthetase
MELNFGFAKINNGKCIMRFDDTNPSAEKEEFVEQIFKELSWLEYEPYKVTYTSDYFDKLYAYAVQLIIQHDAYICELSSDQISYNREHKIESPYKIRAIEESLKIFEEMKNGSHTNFTLRMMGDLHNPNPCLWDTVMYRSIVTVPHGRTGKTWKIYPTYDFSHCIVDSIEGITHSFCTKEFEVRRELYYWFLEKLNLRKPYVYEFAKLNVNSEDGVLSKRKIKSLVNDKIISGWDDQRLLTISGLRNKGFTPTALRTFCHSLGVTKSDSVISLSSLENIQRHELDRSVSRRMVVLEPFKLNIVNFGDIPDDKKVCEFLDLPFDASSVSRKIELTNVVYIENTSFNEIDNKDYYGLAPDKIIRLRCGPFLRAKNISFYNAKDRSIDVEYVDNITSSFNPKKIKGILNWTNNKYEKITIDKYDGLYKKSIVAYAEEHLNNTNIQIGDRYQFERHGYYYFGTCGTFNEIVSLKSKI